MTETPAENNTPLKVGIVLGSSIQPAWIRETLKHIGDSEFAHLEWITLLDENEPSQGSPPVMRGLARRYQAWDARKYGRSTDACALGNIDTEDISPIRRLGSEVSSDTKVDVILSLADAPPRLENLPHLGVWTISIGCDASPTDDTAGFWEVVEKAPVTRVALWSGDSQDGSRKLLSQSFVSTHVDSPHRNKSACCWRAASLIIRELEKARRQDARRALEPGSVPELRSGRLSSLIGHCGGVATHKINSRFCKDQWMMAYKFEARADDCAETLSGLTPLIPPPDRFWADPFPIEREGRYYVFFEEASYTPRLGHLSAMELRRDGTHTEPRVVLQTDYHISYPYIFSYGDSVLMIPETYANNSVDLYECTKFPYEWQLHSTLMPETRAVDTTVFEHDGRWWLFTATGSDEACYNEELFIFHSDSPFGPWKSHSGNPVISDARCARPAGRPFVCNGKLMRPVQDCSRGIYGRALKVREIVTLNSGAYEERDVYGFEPDWCKGLTATHTLNRAGDLLIVDGRRVVRRK